MKERTKLGVFWIVQKSFQKSQILTFIWRWGYHNGEFFFTCPTCPKKFASTKAMKGHSCIFEHILRKDITDKEVGEMDLMHEESKTKDLSAKRFTALNAKIEDVDHNVEKDLDKKTHIENAPVKDIVKIKAQTLNEKSKGESSIFSSSKKVDPESANTLFPCKECGQKLSTERNLEVHLRIHQEQNIKLCRSTGCSEAFETHNLLKEHKIAAHGVNKDKVKEKCDLCELKFHKLGMIKHMVRHSNEKNFVCIECGKRFKRKASLEPHMLIHRGTRNFHCDQCGQDFFSRPSLTNHMQNKHNKENPSICTVCGHDCRNKYNLGWHMARHTGEKKYACRFEGCQTRMRLSHMRTTHEKIHSGRKDHHCTMCPKAFTQKTGLVQHLKRHNGIKDFKCVTCSRAFVEPSGARQCKHTGQSSRSEIHLAKTEI